VRSVWVRGEISNLRRQGSGHCYFSLKDAGSQISAVLFRGDAARQTVDIRDGLQILANGEVSVYEPRGTYQLLVRMVTDDGAGRLQQEFERLKRQLDAEGLFDPSRKQPLPSLPATIGFITSPTGAALQDFLRILKRRRWNGRVVVLPAKVQGQGSAEEMIEMIYRAQRLNLFDLLVIGRGGGSLEDLWAFNEEPLVRAVAACKIPIISAVGHEIDFALTDFAADVRAETPSAAAELISSAFVQCRERFSSARQNFEALTGRYLRDLSRQITVLGNQLRILSPRHRIEQEHLRLDDLANRLNSATRHLLHQKRIAINQARENLQIHSPAARIKLLRQQLASLNARLERASAGTVRVKRDRIEQMTRHLNSLNPRSILQRGFVLVKDAEGRLVTRAARLKKGASLVNEFADGNVKVKVESTDA
jgi:exodeoxyribonuclease VII large subunit